MKSNKVKPDELLHHGLHSSESLPTCRLNLCSREDESMTTLVRQLYSVAEGDAK